MPSTATDKRRPAIWMCLVGIVCLASSSRPRGQSGGQFRARTDVVQIEVSVLDHDGLPIRDLSADRFQVEIAGGARRVLSADFVSSGGSDTHTNTALPSVAGAVETAVPTGSAPTYVMGIDAITFGNEAAAGVSRAAKGFVDSLPGNPSIGIVTFPLGPNLDPTTDREAVKSKLADIRGLRAPAVASAFRLRDTEIVDYLASDSGRAEEHREIILRHCPANDQQCGRLLDVEIRTAAVSLEAQARASLGILRRNIDSFAGIAGRKILVLVSAGMPVTDRPGGRPDIGNLPLELGEAVARANVTLYTLFIDRSLLDQFSAATRGSMRDVRDMSRDSDLESRWLDQFSGTSGGALVKVMVDNGEAAFARIVNETAAYYVLNVEAAEKDRTGRPRELKVKLAGKGLTVRNRQWVVIPKP